jgi:hypothetical protein
MQRCYDGPRGTWKLNMHQLCTICEHCSSVRGICPGSDCETQPSCFVPAANRNGEFSPNTGERVPCQPGAAQQAGGGFTSFAPAACACLTMDDDCADGAPRVRGRDMLRPARGLEVWRNLFAGDGPEIVKQLISA